MMFIIVVLAANPNLSANQVLATLHPMMVETPVLLTAWAYLCFFVNDDTGLQWDDIVFPGIAVPRRPANYQPTTMQKRLHFSPVTNNLFQLKYPFFNTFR